MDNAERTLQGLLDTMDVPVLRRNDLGWLARNLAIRNVDNPNLEQALDIIKNLRR